LHPRWVKIFFSAAACPSPSDLTQLVAMLLRGEWLWRSGGGPPPPESLNHWGYVSSPGNGSLGGEMDHLLCIHLSAILVVGVLLLLLMVCSGLIAARAFVADAPRTVWPPPQEEMLKSASVRNCIESEASGLAPPMGMPVPIFSGEGVQKDPRICSTTRCDKSTSSQCQQQPIVSPWETGVSGKQKLQLGLPSRMSSQPKQQQQKKEMSPLCGDGTKTANQRDQPHEAQALVVGGRGEPQFLSIVSPPRGSSETPVQPQQGEDALPLAGGDRGELRFLGAATPPKTSPHQSLCQMGNEDDEEALRSMAPPGGGSAEPHGSTSQVPDFPMPRRTGGSDEVEFISAGTTPSATPSQSQQKGLATVACPEPAQQNGTQFLGISTPPGSGSCSPSASSPCSEPAQRNGPQVLGISTPPGSRSRSPSASSPGNT